MMSTGRDTPNRSAHRRPAKPDVQDDVSARLIRETETGLLYGLRFPERFPRIPTVEVGQSAFDPALAERYWAERLGLGH